MVGRILSFWDDLVSGTVSVSGKVVSLKEWQKKLAGVEKDNLDWLVAKNFRGELLVLGGVCNV